LRGKNADLDAAVESYNALVRDGVRLRRVEPRVATVEDLYFAIRRSVQGGGSLGHPAPVGTPDHQPAGRVHTHSPVPALTVPANREETR